MTEASVECWVKIMCSGKKETDATRRTWLRMEIGEKGNEHVARTNSLEDVVVSDEMARNPAFVRTACDAGMAAPRHGHRDRHFLIWS